jgi:cyclic beta-1,2-glucan synthetase
MAEVDTQLIRRADSLALLFTPPFSHSTPDPGYIQGYPPGLRENGGQYTHAAAWSVMAFAALGQGDKAAELFAMLNPVCRSTSRSAAHRYKVEPYVVAADIYSVAPQVGRGGWTWYTGSAGWLYRAGLESILGFRLQGTRLVIAPCIPNHWPQYAISFRYRTARYEILVENPDQAGSGAVRLALDGQWLPDGSGAIDLQDDGGVHTLRVILRPVAGL